MSYLRSSHIAAWLLSMLLVPGGAASVSAREDVEIAPIFADMDTVQPVWAANGMVASQEALATRVGVDILRRGGNAVDAAVGVGFALAVTLPRAGNLGGGGFMVIHLAEGNEVVAIDYREMAPGKAHQDMFLDEEGEVDRQKTRFHGLSSGVPGSVRGLELALERYGTLSLEEVVAPAIRLAADGITMTHDLARSLRGRTRQLARWPSTAKIFYKPDGGFYEEGERFVQRDLANTLKAIAARGSAGFYEGEVAGKIARAIEEAGGVMTVDDLAAYRAVIREPVRGRYRGFDVYSMPPPSSGGVHLIQMLNILEHGDLRGLGHNSAAYLHHLVESMRFAYADRSEYLGDPDYFEVPIAALTSKAYAKTLYERIDPQRATPSGDVRPGDLAPYESPETTHYSVVDRWGNAVATTTTINFSYGSGLVAEGTGVLMNNEMDDFAAKPNEPNAFGLLGGEANAVAPGKRPLSSMTPTIVSRDGRPYLVTGSPGGSQIITTTLQLVLNVTDFEMNVGDATYAPRIHHQWYPDELRVENTLNIDTIRLLEQRGHRVKRQSAMGSTQSIMVTADGFYGSSDPRRAGALTAGY